jgi:hypothetical protein
MLDSRAIQLQASLHASLWDSTLQCLLVTIYTTTFHTPLYFHFTFYSRIPSISANFQFNNSYEVRFPKTGWDMFCYTDAMRLTNLVRTPVGTRDFLLACPIQIGSGTHPARCTVGTVSLYRRQSGRGVALSTHIFWRRGQSMDRAIRLLALCFWIGKSRSDTCRYTHACYLVFVQNTGVTRWLVNLQTNRFPMAEK